MIRFSHDGPRSGAAALAVLLLVGASPADPKPIHFEVKFTPDVQSAPITGRVYVMLGPASGGVQEPRFGPDWFRPQPFFAVDAKEWKPGEALKIGEEAIGFPGPLSELKPGDYQAQAVIRLNPDTHSIGDGEGNAFGPVAMVHVGAEAIGATALTVNKVVPPRPFRETDRIKLVDIPSPMLSAFHKRPIRHKAAVLLPKARDEATRLPTLYIIPGFGGDHFMVSRLLGDPRFAYAEDMIRVVLSPDCGTGHHVFADSAANGPRGKALVEELIPHIEAKFSASPEPSKRLLNGHSSGGWSSLWLQTTYPDVFGGTWSTSPDPVDFRKFQVIDIYEPAANAFRDRKGDRLPVARLGGRPALFYEDFSRMEDVIGEGGQLRSFEAVFSPLGADGKARKLWDRKNGAIDPEVARAWEAYDIRLVLERAWKTLGPKLAGKIHVITGDLDTFYLDGAAVLLKASLKESGSDAVVEIVPGKDHFNLIDAKVSARLDREMKAAIAKVRPSKTPRAAAVTGGR